MHPTDFLALLRAAGVPTGLPLREVDKWVAERLNVSERAARGYRLSGHVPQVVMLALKGMAGPVE